jgi:hypothetical protein
MAPEPSRPLARAARIAAVAAALAMLAYRFAQLDLAPFARDEPQFLAAAREQLRTGHWLSANPLYGNLGLRYGPAAFWFYGAVQALVGDGPRVAIVAMGLLVTLAQLLFALALVRLVEGGAVLFAVVVAWMAASPYEFLWSRLAWDLTSNAAVFAAAALLASYRELRPPWALALGLALGLGLATHPIVLPMAAGVLVAIVWEERSRLRQAARPLAVLVGTMVAVNVPYLVFLARAPVVGRTPRVATTPSGLVTLALQAPRIWTTWGFAYYFDDAWPDFRAWLGAETLALDTTSSVGLAVATAAAIAGIAVALASSEPRRQRMGRAALVAWAGTILLLALAGLGLHPHYHFSAAWVPVFGLAATVGWLRLKRPPWGAAALALVVALAGGQFLVLVRWMGYVRERVGTRTPSYGTPIGAESDATRAICAGPEPLVVVRNRTALFRFPIEYLATTEPLCRGKAVVVCADADRQGPFTRPCPLPTDGARVVRLEYASARGGALALDGVPTSPPAPR